MGVYANADRQLDPERRFDRANKAADSVRGSHVLSIGFYDAAIHEAQIHRERLLEDVNDDDAQKVREATSKANLIHLAEQEDVLALTFCKEKNGIAKPYSLQTIKTRESDHHHVVIGVKQE